MNISCSNQDPCPVILDSKCVIYEGENLVYIGVNTNDNLRVALQKINTTIENIVLFGAGIIELTGDVLATGPGITPATLATVNSTPGQYGSSTAIPKITVDAKGRVTAIATDPVFIPSGSLNFIGDVTGSGNTGSDTTLTLKTVNSNTYLNNSFLKFAVNGKGLVTSASVVMSADIITALGYTPYNSTNPAGYITGITSSDVTTALGYTPYDAANPANYISRLGLSASAPLSYNNTSGQFSIQEADATHNGYISSTDWNTFNNKQAAGNYITDLNGEATAAGPGVASVTLNNAAVTGKVLTGLNITGGSVAAADSILTAFGKVQNQINGLIGGSIYQGVWDASTNTPALASGVGTKGHYYIVNVAGSTNLDGITDWNLGDWAIFDGTAWQQVDNTDAVVSVNGQTGAVSLTTDNISEGLTNQYFTTSRARLALSGGTGISYDNVTGIITNTLDLSGYVPYNGATGPVNLGNYNLTVKEIVIGTGAKDNTNIAIGRNSMSYLSSGTGNVALGVDALYFNGANGNVVIGYEAGYYSNQGNNVTIGYQAGRGNGPASNSVAIGYQAMLTNTNGSSNIAIGYQAGSQLYGSNNTIIGGYVGTSMSDNIVLADGVGNIRYRYDGTNNNFYQKVIFGSTLGNGTYTYTLPGATGTLALTSDIPSLTGYVPYTGATANVNLGTYGLISDYLQLNNTPSGVPTTAGTMAWNDTDGTLDIRLKGGNVTLQTGQETLVRVVNKTDNDLLEANYQVVRIRTAAEGGAQGQRLAVKLAQANTKAGHTGILGLVTENINNNQEGFVTTFGLVRDINTTGSLQGETWTDGTTLWLSDTVAGGLTSVQPTTHPVQIGYVVYAHQNNGKIFVLLQQGVDELSELHDVNITSVANNQGLFYNSTTSAWENKSIATALGYTPANAATYLPLSGGTLTGALNGTNAYFSSNVGIGTNNPLGDLHISNPTAVSAYIVSTGGDYDTNLYLGYADALTETYIKRQANNLVFGTSNTDILTIGYNGVAAFSSYITATGYFVSNTGEGYYTTLNGSNGMMVYGSSNTTVLMSGGNETLVANGSGNVGIGTSSPISRLDINNGNIRMGEILNSASAYIGKQYSANSNFYSSVQFYSTSGEDAIIFNTHLSGVSSGERLRITGGGTVQPGANGTQDLGTSSLRWATVYTSDLDMSNGVGDYTIVEGREDLFLYNNITKKVFKFALIEVDPSIATPKKTK